MKLLGFPRRTWHALLAVLVLGLVAVGCGSEHRSSGSTSGGSGGGGGEVRLALQPLWEYAPWVVAHDKGFDREQGLDLKISWLTQVAPEIEAMRRGDFDMISTCTACNFSFYRSAPNLRDVLITDQYKGFIVVGRKDAPTYQGLIDGGASPEQARREIYDYLKGKTFVLHKPVFGALVTGMLESAGLQPSDVKIVDMPDDAKGATAFRSGTGDMFMGGTPQVTKLLMDPDGRYVSMGGTQILGAAGLWYSTMAVDQSFLDKDAATNQKLLAIWYRTMNYLAEQPDEVIAAMREIVNSQTGSDFSMEQARIIVTQLDKFFTVAEAKKTVYNPRSDLYWKNSLDYYSRQHVASGDLDASVDVDEKNVEEQQFDALLRDRKLMDWINAPVT